MKSKKLYPMLLLFALLTACAAKPLSPEPVSDFPPVEIVSPEPEPVPQPEPEPEAEIPSVLTEPVSMLSMQPDSDLAGANWPYDTLQMPAAPFVEHDTFYFPLQFTAEAMGVSYEQNQNTVTLRWEGHETQLFVGERRFIVDGVAGERTGEHALFREGLPRVPVDDSFTPIERDGVVFLPLEFLPVEFRAAYNSFGAQPRPILSDCVDFQNDMLLDLPDPDAPCAVTLFAYQDQALVNGELTQMPAAPFPDKELLYIPLAFLADISGADYARDGDVLRLTSGGHILELTLGSRIWRIDGEAGVAQQTMWWSNNEAAPEHFVPLERDGEVFIPTDFLPRDYRLPICSMNLCYERFHGMVYYEVQPDAQCLAGYRLGTIYDELPAELREGMVSQGIVDTEVRMEYDVEAYSNGGVHLRVYRLREGWSNEELMDGEICAIAVTDPDIPTYRGLRVGDTPRRAWELYGVQYADSFSFQYTPPDGPITLIGIHGLYYAGFDLPNYYIAGVPEAWLQAPSSVE